MGWCPPQLGDGRGDTETVSDLPKDTQLPGVGQGLKYRSSVSKLGASTGLPLPSQGKPILGTWLSLNWPH